VYTGSMHSQTVHKRPSLLARGDLVSGRNVNIAKNGRNRFLHSSLLKIWDFFHSCEKLYVFSLVPLRSTREKTEFLRLVKEIPDLQ
jgi:hypothetical protein